MLEVTKFEIHPEIHHVQIDYRKSLIDMIAAGHFPTDDEDITVKFVFPITVPEGEGRIIEKELRVVSVTGSEPGALIDVRGLCKVVHEHGFYPSGIEDLVAFGLVASEEVDCLSEGLIALGSQCEIERYVGSRRLGATHMTITINAAQSRLHCPQLIKSWDWDANEYRRRLMKRYMRGHCVDPSHVILISKDL